MIYIGPIYEEGCRDGLNKQILQWEAACQESNHTLAGQIKNDISELQTRWLPSENSRFNRTLGFRARTRYVFGYNANAVIAIYAKFSIQVDGVHLDWVVARPATFPPPVDCGMGVAPLRCIMAFVAEVGRILNKPVILLADNRELIPKYAASGWVANGEEGGKAKMVLTIENIGRPASLEFKGQTKGVHWKWESTNTIEKFLEDGTQ